MHQAGFTSHGRGHVVIAALLFRQKRDLNSQSMVDSPMQLTQ